MHYDVKEMRGVFDRRLKPASKYIAYKMQESFHQRLDADRKKLMIWLDGHGKPAAFLDWLFEGYAHEKLLEKLGVVTLSLSSWEAWKPLTSTLSNSSIAEEQAICRREDKKRVFSPKAFCPAPANGRSHPTEVTERLRTVAPIG
eukprot:scaffold2033_cov164-Amphora_coffeaeformis.AAC.2